MAANEPIFEAMLDHRYRLVVYRLPDDPACCKVQLFDTQGQTPDVPMAEQAHEPLLFGAPFGPDVDDVQSWQEWAIGVVDGEGKET